MTYKKFSFQEKAQDQEYYQVSTQEVPPEREEELFCEGDWALQ